MTKILTIIVTYNGMKWLDKCLSSVKDSSLPSDLFIVDNGSADGSIEFIERNYPEATFIKSEKNLGFGRANNLGFNHAIENNYDYVYLLNQDAWIESDTFEKMITVSENNPTFAILSPLQTNKDKDKLDHNFNGCIPPQFISDSICRQPIQEIYPTFFTMAAHWLIPVSELKIIGGFSPAFPHYGEDNNLIQRAQYLGYEIGIVPAAIGVHDRENRPSSKDKRRYMNYINTLIILNNPNNKHLGLKFLKRMIGFTLHPSRYTINYFFKSFSAYFSSRKYREASLRQGAFLS